jgi:hypothetical protein
MGQATRNIANSFTTSGVITSSAVNNTTISGITDINDLGGSLILISEQTASADASISFTSGIDSTYDEYWFILNNIHPSGNTGGLGINFSTDGGSNWNVTKTTTSFVAMHAENNAIAQIIYENGYDLAQSTADQEICQNIYTGNDESVSGIIKLYNPSSTTYVKHFISNTQSYFASARSWHHLIAGYCNTTSAINGVIFRFDTNNMDDGTIQMFGVK